MARRGVALAAVLLLLPGCANFAAKITGSPRAGSEQLLLTGTADRAIDCLDFGPLAGATAYLDTSHVASVDAGWLIFALRRAMARQGVLLADEKRDARVIVEAAVAAYGTDEVDCRLAAPGVTAVGNLPLPTSGSTLFAIGRKSRQDAVVKLALTATDAASRRLAWESGAILRTGALDRRFLGTAEYGRSGSLPELDAYPRR